MPSEIYYRTWCIKCQEWEFHYHKYPDWENWYCKKCGSMFQVVDVKDIPKEKIQEHRERYKEANADKASRFLTNVYLGMAVGIGGSGLATAFTEMETRIIECDAGQRRIDNKRKEEQRKARLKRLEELQRQRDEAAKYKGLGRNDICICGSGKKYKKCCLIKIQSYESNL